MRSHTFPRLLAFGVAVLLAVAGCSTLPTQPTASNNASGGTSSFNGGSSEVLGLNLLGSSATTSTRQIGLLGGIVSAGNFSLVIPPGALTTPATVTVSQPDAAHPLVNLSISPASANKFLLPVVLVADAKPMDKSLLAVAYISYYNPSTGRWERVANCSVDLLSLSVSAPLWHFSTYRVESGGKAGW